MLASCPGTPLPWGTVSFCELSSPVQPCCLGRLLLGSGRPGSRSNGTASPFAHPDITLSPYQGLDFCLHAPSSRDQLLSSSSRAKSRFVWLCSILWGFRYRFFFFHFFCRWGRSVGTFTCLSSVCTRRISCWECWREVLDSESGSTAWQGRPWVLSL